jgi:hypothetical protein
MYQTPSHVERLSRWATVLEAADVASIQPFRDVEFFSPTMRAGLRKANSALDLAYSDPVLRRSGLGSDRFGDGAAFFGLSEQQAHRLLCSCGYFGTVQPREVARRIRAIAARRRLRDRISGAVPAFARWIARRRTASYAIDSVIAE